MLRAVDVFIVVNIKRSCIIGLVEGNKFVLVNIECRAFVVLYSSRVLFCALSYLNVVYFVVKSVAVGSCCFLDRIFSGGKSCCLSGCTVGNDIKCGSCGNIAFSVNREEAYSCACERSCSVLSELSDAYLIA